jgi:hypothetical protein
MAGELLVINPRRRRRRARKARATHRRKTRRRHSGYALSNPRRRRRRAVSRRRHSRRRHHRNPSLGGLGGGIAGGLKTGLGIGIGVIATEVATSAAVKYIPGIPAQLQSGLGLSALKVGVGGLALPFILKKVGQHQLARNVAIGAYVSVIVDLLHQYVTPHLGLSDYTTSMSDYTTTMGDYGAPEEVGAAENMYGDTMYGLPY